MEQVDVDSKAPDLGNGMAVADSPESVVAEESPELTLAQKIVAIRKECAGIGKEDISMQAKKKNGDSYTINYKAHTIEGVLVAVRHLLNQYNVIVSPSLVERTYNGNRCDVVIDFVWECADTGTARTIRWAGSDTDYGGKGFAKAGTNALKEHLKKFLLITDRDDAKEETENLEHQTEEGMTRKAAQEAEEKVKAMFHTWAKTLKTSIMTCPDTAALTRLKRDNTEQLKNPDLPKVTKEFIEELFKDRNSALEAFEADADKNAKELE